MADGLTELAILLKDRENKSGFDICTAKVIRTNPLELKIGEKIFLGREYKNLTISENVSRKEIKTGENIIVVPTGNGAMWFAIDREG